MYEVIKMAKTPEEKAAKQAEREAKQQAKEEAKAEKMADKADRRAEKDQIVNLKSAQDAEILAYKQALAETELSNKEIKNLLQDEKVANRAEVDLAKETLAADGLQYIGITGTRSDGTEYRGPIVSRMDTIGEEYHEPIVEDIRGALSFYRDYNLPGLSARGNATIGIGLDDILKVEYSKDPVTGEYTKTSNLAKTLDRAQDYVHNTFSADELREQGVRLKEDKNNPGLYTWKFGSEENKGYIFFKDNGDGTYTGIGANRLDIDIPDRNFLEQAFIDVPLLPEIAAIGASFIPGAQPFVGEIYAAGKGLQSAATGGDFEDILKAAGLAYLGAEVMPGVVGNVLPADIAAIPGVVPGVSRTAMGVLSGKDFDEALRSGLASGLGAYTGAEIADVTGRRDIGKVGGALTQVALSGGDVSQALQDLITSQALQYGAGKVFSDEFRSTLPPSIQGVLPDKLSTSELITDPTAQRIAEGSLLNIVRGKTPDFTPSFNVPVPVPGFIRRLVDDQTMAQSGAPVKVAAGGRIRAPIRRNVKELIPLRKGGLAMAGMAR